MTNLFPIEGIFSLILHVHCITRHCSVLCVSQAGPRLTPQCNVSNIKATHSERRKFLPVSNIKRIYSALGNSCQFIACQFIALAVSLKYAFNEK